VFELRILYVSTLYPPSIGGAQIQLHCLAKAMQRAGHAVQVLTLTGKNRNDWLRLSTVFGEQPRHYEHEGIAVDQIGFSTATRLRVLPWALAYYALMGPSVKRLSAVVRAHIEQVGGTPSLVHVTRIGREFIARAALDFAREHGIPYVLTPNHHPRWRGPLYREYDRIYREADALCVYTPSEKETLVREKGVAEERVHVTGVGPVLSEHFSAEAFREAYGLHGPFVLFLGQQYKYKGIQAMIDAAPLVWEEHPRLKFVFVGPHTGDSHAVFQGISDPRLVNLGRIDLESKTSALAACEFLCLPSVQESFGGVYAEAWCHEKAVIGGRIAPIACVIKEGRDGLLSSQEPKELADKMLQLLSDPEAAAAMGRAGWQKVQEKYSWERLAEKTLGVYTAISE